MFPDVRELETFQYTFGDPRPVFMQYMCQAWPERVHTYVKPDAVTPSKTLVMDCDPTIKRRRMEMMKEPQYTAFKNAVKADTSPFLLIPITIINREACTVKNLSKHVNYLLYNRVTGEMIRLDIKRYHLDGFRIKLLINALSGMIASGGALHALVPKIVGGLQELSVPAAYMRAFGADVSVRKVYPLFVLHYIARQMAHPEKTMRSVLYGMAHIKPESILRAVAYHWNVYSSFHREADKAPACPAPAIRNLETGRCIKRTAAYIAGPTTASCPGDKVYHPWLQRCVPPAKLNDVDVMLDIAPASASAKYRHVQEKAAVTVGIMNFIMSKYPYARFVRPLDPQLLLQKKELSGIGWSWAADKRRFVARYPREFWESFKQGVLDPNIRFLIAFISLTSKTGAKHTNCLIYDKRTHEMERFDSHGRDANDDAYGHSQLDKHLQAQFKKRKRLFRTSPKYFTPMEFCPKMNIFQFKEADEVPVSMEDLRGNCAVWRFWYVECRLANPDVPRHELIIMAMNKLKQHTEFGKFMKAYRQHLLRVGANMARKKDLRGPITHKL